MPYPVPAGAQARIDAGRTTQALLLDFYLKDGAGDALTLRCWNWPGELSYPAVDHIDGADPVTYADMHRRIEIERSIRFSTSLASEPLRVTLDGSTAGDDDDFTGKLTDAKWHQRTFRIRQVELLLDTGESPTDPVWSWRGRLDERSFTRQADNPTKLVITAQGGTFRIRGRRMHTRTHADQQRRLAGDKFFEGTPLMVAIPPLWMRSYANIPGNRGGGITISPGINAETSDHDVAW
jgi:hypothetical protein